MRQTWSRLWVRMPSGVANSWPQERQRLDFIELPARANLAGVGKWVPGRVGWAQGEVVARPVSVDHSRGRLRGELP